jgi:hypothetical protein
MTQTTISTPTKQTVQDEIALLAQELPYDSLITLREFGRFLHFQRQQQGKAEQTTPATNTLALQKIVPGKPQSWKMVPADEVLKLTNVLTEGYEGDALEDTEAIADDV